MFSCKVESDSCNPMDMAARLFCPWNSPGKITGVGFHFLLQLGSITLSKTSGGDGIPAELFQILKDDVVKVMHSICPQIWKTQQWPEDKKISVFIPIRKKGNTCQRMFKLQHNCTHFTCKQNKAQNPSSEASTVRELRTSRF